MALTVTSVAQGEITSSPSNPQATGAFDGLLDNLFLIMISNQKVGGAITITGLSGPIKEAYQIARFATWASQRTIEFWVARGNGLLSTALSITWDNPPGASVEWAVYRIGGVPFPYVRQVATATTTSAIASVTLPAAVLNGSECAYMAAWSSASAAGTPGSGWTELLDATMTNLHQYVQYNASPSGSQNGQVSGISSQANAACIMEIAQGRHGWGVSI